MIPLKDDNPTNGKPIVSYGIIIFCVIIFLSQLSLNEIELREFTYSYGLIPSVLMGHDQLPLDFYALPAFLTNCSYLFPTYSVIFRTFNYEPRKYA